MSREVKRVPLDFDWPLNKTWRGYVNPYHIHAHDCQACGGSGCAPEAKRISDQWYGDAHFDPVAYGAEPITAESPALREAVTRKIQWSQQLAKQEGTPEFYTANGSIPFEVAVNREMARLAHLWRHHWCHHLIQNDVDALVKAGRAAPCASGSR